MSLKLIRKVGGVVYNTETSKMVRSKKTTRTWCTLYRTPKNAFFLVTVPRSPKAVQRSDELMLQPLSVEQAREWMQKYFPRSVDMLFEKEPSQQPTTMMSMRVSLREKARVLEAVAKSGKSMNDLCRAAIAEYLERNNL